MTIKPPLRWPGGKTRLLKQLIPLIRPHTLFVEAFAGGAALTLAKEPSKVEVINDINGELVNLYRHAQFHLEALLTEVDTYAAWDSERMAAFAGAVGALQGDWIVTVNDSAENRALFRGHEIRPVVTHSGAVNRRERPDATFGELIIRRRGKRALVANALPLAA